MEMNSLLSKNATTIKTQHNLSSFQDPGVPSSLQTSHNIKENCKEKSCYLVSE